MVGVGVMASGGGPGGCQSDDSQLHAIRSLKFVTCHCTTRTLTSERCCAAHKAGLREMRAALP
jgi:hypothetical protein